MWLHDKAPRKPHKLSEKHLCDTASGELHGTNDCSGKERFAVEQQSRLWLALSVRAEWRSAQLCHLSLLTFSDSLAGCTWNNRQEVKGLGLTYTPAYTHAAWWATQLYKVSFTLSASRYAIHMDGHASSLGHTYSASQNSKWPFGMQVHFLWGISFAYHLL